MVPRLRFASYAAGILVALPVATGCREDESPAGGTGEVVVGRVEVTPANIELDIGDAATITVTAWDEADQRIGRPVLDWTSSAPLVAAVTSAGVVTAIAEGNSTVRVRSGSASAAIDVRVVPRPPTEPVVVIHPGVEYQRMTGWEGVAQVGEVECNRQAFGNYRLPLIDRLVNELGINRVRLEIRSGHENPVDHYSRYVTGDVANWQSNRYNAINDNSDPNVANAAGFQFAELDHKVDAIITPMRAALAARGERLYVNLTYVDFGVSPFEHSASPAEYAELVSEAFRHLQNAYGWVPDAVEVILEPDNTQNWRGATIGAALVAAGERLAREGYRPAFIAPSTASMSQSLGYLDDILAVPGVRDYLTDFAYHRYSGVSAATLESIGKRTVSLGVRSGMLEHIGSPYQDLHDDLRDGRVSSWEQFTLAYCLEDRGGAYYVIDQTNPAVPVINLGVRARFLRHYFSFIRLDAVRVGAESGDARFAPLAFRNVDGKLVVVLRATASGTVELRQLPSGTYGVVRTSGSLTFAPGSDVQVTDGRASITMPASGVMTVFQR